MYELINPTLTKKDLLVYILLIIFPFVVLIFSSSIPINPNLRMNFILLVFFVSFSIFSFLINSKLAKRNSNVDNIDPKTIKPYQTYLNRRQLIRTKVAAILFAILASGEFGLIILKLIGIRIFDL